MVALFIFLFVVVLGTTAITASDDINIHSSITTSNNADVVPININRDLGSKSQKAKGKKKKKNLFTKDSDDNHIDDDGFDVPLSLEIEANTWARTPPAGYPISYEALGAVCGCCTGCNCSMEGWTPTNLLAPTWV